MRSDEVWFVTGASSGLGRELAIAAAEAGATVVASARRIDPILDLAESHDRIVPIQLDVTDAGRVERAVGGVIDEYGFIDVVVNCAGSGVVGAAEETSDSELRDLMEVNFFGAVAVTRAALPHMRQRRSGTIIQISSVLGVTGFVGSSAYCATKFALTGYSESLADEVEPLGIRVLIVEPGGLRTEFAGPALTKAALVIEDYAATAGDRRTYMDDINGTQIGDPTRAAAAILTALDDPEPPLHLLLGGDAVWLARDRLTKRIAVDSEWRALGRSTDIE